MPILTNLRLDPFERTGWASDGAAKGSMQYWEWFKYEFWRFVFVQQNVANLAKSALEYPPMQAGASFNLDAVKAELAKKMEEAQAAAKGPGN
jgi:arylsulfatase